MSLISVFPRLPESLSFFLRTSWVNPVKLNSVIIKMKLASTEGDFA
jgi:hypothetical protein